MLLTGDYHTHTIYSHGKETVLENAERAKQLGIKQLGISDHGFDQMAFGLRHKKISSLKNDILKAREITGVDVLLGIEANLCGEDGQTDLLEEDYADFDLFLMGIHRFVAFSNFKSWYNVFWRNYYHSAFTKKPPKSLVDFNTKAYINAIKKFPIDAITHLNYLCFCDVEEVAKAARDYGTYIELNSKKNHLTDDQLEKVRNTGVRFIINSDAHSVSRIGDTKLVEEQLSRVNIPTDMIDNINGKTPNFRFKEYKIHNL